MIDGTKKQDDGDEPLPVVLAIIVWCIAFAAVCGTVYCGVSLYRWIR